MEEEDDESHRRFWHPQFCITKILGIHQLGEEEEIQGRTLETLSHVHRKQEFCVFAILLGYPFGFNTTDRNLFHVAVSIAVYTLA